MHPAAWLRDGYLRHALDRTGERGQGLTGELHVVLPLRREGVGLGLDAQHVGVHADVPAQRLDVLPDGLQDLVRGRGRVRIRVRGRGSVRGRVNPMPTVPTVNPMPMVNPNPMVRVRVRGRVG